MYTVSPGNRVPVAEHGRFLMGIRAQETGPDLTKSPPCSGYMLYLNTSGSIRLSTSPSCLNLTRSKRVGSNMGR